MRSSLAAVDRGVVPGRGEALLKRQILELVRQYRAVAFPEARFEAGRTPIRCAGPVWGDAELERLGEAVLDLALTRGRYTACFEKDFARLVGVRDCLLVNSGASANLAAVSALTSPRMGKLQLEPGDEVITAATAPPATVNPILHNRLVPVFVDVTVPAYNLDLSRIEEALSPLTRAVIVPHMFGNPVDLEALSACCATHNLWLVEDCHQAAGATFRGRSVGTYGQFATFDFGAGSHIAMGEGGAVVTNTPLYRAIAESFRDGGRDCWCPPGEENTCGRRFDWKLGGMPCGYDHQNVYSHAGYGLGLADLGAAVGLAQLEKLAGFVDARRYNFHALREGLSDLEEFFVLPEATPWSNPSWSGFPLAVRNKAGFTRDALARFLAARGIEARLVGGGNLALQPAYAGRQFRADGELPVAGFVMSNAFWVGVHPGLCASQIAYLLEAFHDAAAKLRP